MEQLTQFSCDCQVKEVKISGDYLLLKSDDDNISICHWKKSPDSKLIQLKDSNSFYQISEHYFMVTSENRLYIYDLWDPKKPLKIINNMSGFKASGNYLGVRFKKSLQLYDLRSLKRPLKTINGLSSYELSGEHCLVEYPYEESNKISTISLYHLKKLTHVLREVERIWWYTIADNYLNIESQFNRYYQTYTIKIYDLRNPNNLVKKIEKVWWYKVSGNYLGVTFLCNQTNEMNMIWLYDLRNPKKVVRVLEKVWWYKISGDYLVFTHKDEKNSDLSVIDLAHDKKFGLNNVKYYAIDGTVLATVDKENVCKIVSLPSKNDFFKKLLLAQKKRYLNDFSIAENGEEKVVLTIDISSKKPKTEMLLKNIKNDDKKLSAMIFPNTSIMINKEQMGNQVNQKDEFVNQQLESKVQMLMVESKKVKKKQVKDLR